MFMLPIQLIYSAMRFCMDEKTIIVDNHLKQYTDGNFDSDFNFESTQTSETIEVEKIKIEDFDNFTYQDLREVVNILCDLAFKVFFIGYGILQFFAISSGLLRIFHHDGILVLLISSVLAFLPVVGSILGAVGAYASWGWSIWNTLLVFSMPYLIIHGPMFMIIFFETYKDIRRWQAEKRI